MGPLGETREGQIGEATYTYPVVEVEQFYLWPRDTPGYTSEPQFHFGWGSASTFGDGFRVVVARRRGEPATHAGSWKGE